MEYNGGLEKAILRDSELLSEVNDAFCKSHPLLAQKVVTRSARAAVSKIGAEALVSKAPSVQRAKAGSLLKTICEINAMKLGENDILVGHRYHTAGSEPFFLNTSYTYTKRLGAIPVDLNGRCVVSEEIGDRDKVTMHPLNPYQSTWCHVVHLSLHEMLSCSLLPEFPHYPSLLHVGYTSMFRLEHFQI